MKDTNISGINRSYRHPRLLVESRCSMGLATYIYAWLLSNFALSFDISGSDGGICDSTKALIEIEIRTDNYGNETSWKVVLENEEDTTIMQNQTVLGNMEVYSYYSCRDKNDCFTFTLVDSFSDGIGCDYSHGSYLILLDGFEVASGNKFEESVSTTFGYGCSGSVRTPLLIPSSIPTLQPTQVPTLRNHQNSMFDKSIGPITQKNINMHFYGLGTVLGGTNLTILEYRMKSFIEKFYKYNSTTTIQKYVKNFQTSIVVTSQKLSVHSPKERSLFDSNGQKLDRITKYLDNELIIQYTQTVTYLQESSTKLNVESLFGAPFSTSSRRQAFIHHLKKSDDSGGYAFDDLYKVDRPVFPSFQDTDGSPYIPSGKSLFHGFIVGAIAGGTLVLLTLQTAFCMYLKRQKYGKSADQPTWPVHAMQLSENVEGPIPEDLRTIKRSQRNAETLSKSSTSKNDITSPSPNQSINMFDQGFHSDDILHSPQRDNGTPRSKFSDVYDIMVRGEQKDSDLNKEKQNIKNDIDPEKGAPSFHRKSEGNVSQEDISRAVSESPKTLIKDKCCGSENLDGDIPSIFSTTSSFERLYNETDNHISIEKVIHGFLTSGGKEEKRNQSLSLTPSNCRELVGNEENLLKGTKDEIKQTKDCSDLPEDNLLFDPKYNDEAYYDHPDMREEIAFVYAPPGKLGIILDKSERSEPIIHAVKETSCLSQELQKGDRIITIDGQDVSSFTPLQISKMLARKRTNPIRLIIVKRKVYYGTLCTI